MFWPFQWQKRLAELDRLLDVLDSLITKGLNLMAALDDAITKLQADVAAETSATQAAITLLNGLNAQLQAALAAAANAGASPAQLASVAAVSTAIEAQTSALAAAVAANTPAAPAP